jgi:hypothetical protein
VLGAGTADPDLVPREHRRDVSRTAGWIAPVVVDDGRVVGTWSLDDGGVTPFDGTLDDLEGLEREQAVWRRVLTPPD